VGCGSRFHQGYLTGVMRQRPQQQQTAAQPRGELTATTRLAGTMVVGVEGGGVSIGNQYRDHDRLQYHRGKVLSRFYDGRV